MTRPTDDMRVLAFPGYTAPAARLAHRLGCAVAEVAVHRFPDGESLVRLPESLPRQVLFHVSLDQANRQLIELELAAATAPSLGAERLVLVAPYLCYMRQDRAFHPGEAVSQRVIGEMLARRFDTVVTVDPHLHRVRSLREAVPSRRAVVASAAPAMAQWLAAHRERPLLVGPDEESAQWVEAIAAPRGLEHVVASKRRLGDREVRIRLPDTDFTGRDTVLVDDVASTGRTLAAAAKQLVERGAASVTVLVSHALFVGDALACLEAAGVQEVVSTDSVPHPSNRVQLDMVLAEALQET